MLGCCTVALTTAAGTNTCLELRVCYCQQTGQMLHLQHLLTVAPGNGWVACCCKLTRGAFRLRRALAARFRCGTVCFRTEGRTVTAPAGSLPCSGGAALSWRGTVQSDRFCMKYAHRTNCCTVMNDSVIGSKAFIGRAALELQNVQISSHNGRACHKDMPLSEHPASPSGRGWRLCAAAWPT